MVLTFLAAALLYTVMPVEMRTGGDVPVYYNAAGSQPSDFTWTATDTRNQQVLASVHLPLTHVHDTFMVSTAPMFTAFVQPDNWQYIQTDVAIGSIPTASIISRQLFPLSIVFGKSGYATSLAVTQLEFDTSKGPDAGSVYLVMHGTANIENWVPEPSTFVLILLGVLAACTRLKN